MNDEKRLFFAAELIAVGPYDLHTSGIKHHEFQGLNGAHLKKYCP
jgi:hypothetical protein